MSIRVGIRWASRPGLGRDAHADLTAGIRVLQQLCEHEIRTGRAPLIWEAPPIRYERERVGGREHWQTATETVRRRKGDCEDLAAYTAASLREAGIPARAVIEPSSVGWHVVVKLPNGETIDPSAALGMYDVSGKFGRRIKRGVRKAWSKRKKLKRILDVALRLAQKAGGTKARAYLAVASEAARMLGEEERELPELPDPEDADAERRLDDVLEDFGA